MTKCQIFLIILILIKNMAYSAFEYKTSSVQSAGLAGIKTCCKDEANALFYNPALISIQSKLEIDTYYTKFCGMDELANNVVSLAFPILKDRSYLALGYNSFGQNGFYKEEILAVACNLNFSKRFRFGISYKSMFLDLGEMNTNTRIYGIDLGFRIITSERSFLGVMLSNVNRPKIGVKHPEEIYRDFNVGYSFEPIKNIRFMVEGSKIVGFESEHKFGVELAFIENFTLRAGIAPKTKVFSCGVSINKWIDYAYSIHTDLGSEHFVGIKFFV